ncbi:DUF1820 family protein [Thiococcus pfennigii]|jgi:hypothetical protein|uniref:DUF1820 family protein n=1 Tax=Thiococcus pfennigii TaxID=1057 RepID=UPI001903AE6C|nr:DUF1820 family protein [Thiococcus pfennigii]MBK1701353.1 hypothetical protein [Thiococcus pfennigii]MBK1730537.1 hypothetical protein [Thiococcus pfennigii]
MRVFRVAFFNQGKVYEIYARHVRQGEFYGFVEIEGILFGEASSMLVDPAEERLKSEFKGVQRSLIPIHAVVRIDEVAKEGTGKIHELGEGSNITPFPSPSLYAPGKDKDR